MNTLREKVLDLVREFQELGRVDDLLFAQGLSEDHSHRVALYERRKALRKDMGCDEAPS